MKIITVTVLLLLLLLHTSRGEITPSSRKPKPDRSPSLSQKGITRECIVLGRKFNRCGCKFLLSLAPVPLPGFVKEIVRLKCSILFGKNMNKVLKKSCKRYSQNGNFDTIGFSSDIMFSADKCQVSVVDSVISSAFSVFLPPQLKPQQKK